MISVICWKWKPLSGYNAFPAESVNVLKRMVERHYSKPHRFICITDDAKGIDEDVEIIPLWDDFATLPSPQGVGYPSCYRRLRMFGSDMQELLGERVVSVDLDCVILEDLSPLWDRYEDFVGWQDPIYPHQYNGSMCLLRTGTRSEVLTTFDPIKSPIAAKAASFFGSDQAWVSCCLAKRHDPAWTTEDGVFSYRRHLAGAASTPPDNARIVFFHGAIDPWTHSAQQRKWVRENWH